MNWKNKAFSYKNMYFMVTIALVGIILGLIAYADPDIPPLQRAIAKQTSIILNVMGIHAETYDYWVEVHTPTLSENEKKEIVVSLAKLMLIINETETKMVGYNNYLGKGEEHALLAYIEEMRKKGIQIEFYPATVVTDAVIVNIIPGCTGWLGIAIITALILAYPDATKKGRLEGLIMSWAGLYVINVMRLASTIAATNIMGYWAWRILEPLLWRWGMIIVALLIWALWLKYVKKSK